MKSLDCVRILHFTDAKFINTPFVIFSFSIHQQALVHVNVIWKYVVAFCNWLLHLHHILGVQL